MTLKENGKEKPPTTTIKRQNIDNIRPEDKEERRLDSASPHDSTPKYRQPRRHNRS
jgi:hypothetical protein